MFKKLLFLAAGGVLVLGLLFGRNLVPYAGTAISKAQSWADSTVDTSYKIETARNLLKKVEKRIEPMVYEIACQKVEINRLAREVKSADESLARSHSHIMKLRDHLDSGELSYVSTNGRKFGSQQVRENLQRDFRQYKIAAERVEALKATLATRQDGLLAAQENLEATHTRRMELATEIDSLEAQMKMLEVAKTASQYKTFDNSELSRTQEMIEEIKTRIETDATMLQIAPQFNGDIPMEEELQDSGDIIEAVDAYFGGSETTVVKN